MSKAYPQFKDKYYIYALCKPCGTPFYIGKGKGSRINDHFQPKKLERKSLKNTYIRQLGESVKREILCYFDSEEKAYYYEKWLIGYYGLIKGGGLLTNVYIETANFLTEERISRVEKDPLYWQTKVSHTFEDLEKAFILLKDGSRDCQDVSKLTNISAAHLAGLFYRRDVRIYEVNLIFEKHGMDKLEYKVLPKPRKNTLTVDKIKHYHNLWLKAEMSISDIASETGYSHDNINRIFLGKQMVGVVDTSLKPVARKTVISTSVAEKILTLRHIDNLSYRKIAKKLNIAKSNVQRVCELKGSNIRFKSFVEELIRNKNG